MSESSRFNPGASAGTALGTSGPGAEDRLREALRRATLGEFEVYDELGRGGMARVYLCYDLALDRHVAIKVISPSLLLEEGMAERFRREAKISASLSHPNIIPVYAVRQTDELAFFVMKYVDGCTLNFVVSEHAPLPIDLVRQLVLQIAGALVYAHGRGVVHRDIKPANILIDSDGRAILTDFGIARATGLSGLTATGASVGTPYYMSPEQCSRGEITGHSDQYALGVMTYQMLSGKLPFVGKDAGEVMSAHLLDPPQEISALRRECPPDLSRVVMRMLAKKPADRWSSLDEVVKELQWKQVGLEEQSRTQLIALARTGPARPSLPSPPTSPAPSSRRVPVSNSVHPETGRGSWKRPIMVAGGLAILGVGGVLLWSRMVAARQAAISPPAPPPAVTRQANAPPVPETSATDSAQTNQPPPPPAEVKPQSASLAPAPRTSPSPRKPAVKPDSVKQDVIRANANDSLPQNPPGAAPPPVAPSPWAWVQIGTKGESTYLYINGVAQFDHGPFLRLKRVPAGQVSLGLSDGRCISWDTTFTARDTVRIGYRGESSCPP